MMHSPLPRVAPEQRLVLALEGNIGIGKSTLLANLRKHFALDTSVVFVDEPVALWEKHGLLAAMYSNQISRCAFQLMAVSTRYSALLDALRNPAATLIITERSVMSDRWCFAEVNLQSAPDRAAYAVTHDALVGALPNDLRHAMVLLKAPRRVLHKRIAKRGRAAEKDAEKPDGDQGDSGGGIPDDYLSKLDAAHANYFEQVDPMAKRQIDATQTPAEVTRAVIEAIETIRQTSPRSPASVMDPMDLL